MLPERDAVFIAQMIEAARQALDFTRGLSRERNVVVHDYADVDMDLVWKTVREDLPPLVARLQTLIEG